jgi:dihydropteroate synthase
MKIPKIFGILNITPDSFSDGGDYYNINAALDHAREMILAGVNIIDIGAVSTRPNGNITFPEEEVKRLEVILPELRNITLGTNVQISLDSYNYRTVDEFISYIDIINDVTGMEDKNMQALALESGKEVVFMHSMGIPVNNSLNCLDPEQDVIKFLCHWRDQKIKELLAKGFSLEKLTFDPGIGFGKNSHQSLAIITRVSELVSKKIKILIGHSRKSFLTLFGEKDPKKRDLETHIISTYLFNKNIDYIRVHDVSGTQRVISLYTTLYNS